MATDNQRLYADPSVVHAWVQGWTIARETAAPVSVAGGYRVDVGWSQQRARYVFAACSEAMRRCAESIVEPWVLLKVCDRPEHARTLLPPRWTIERVGYMLTCSRPMAVRSRSVPGEYSLASNEDAAVPIVRILTTQGQVAAIGRVAVAGNFAIYDRIETHADHRRRGLASAVMAELERAAMVRGATRGVLVGTADGRALYESLGWELHSLYTTAVIREACD